MTMPIVIYHTSCADGLTAAWVARMKLGNCGFISAQHGQDPPDVRGRDVFILDFSYKRGVTICIVSDAASVTIIDHHRTAASELDGLADECAKVYGLHPPTIVFDMEKSGARLAWEFFCPGEPAPWLVEYTEDRDLWRWILPDSREVSAALASYPWTFAQWDVLHDDPGAPGRLAAEGIAIERYKTLQIEKLCRHAHEIEIDGHKILAVNTPLLISEVAGKLAEGRPFGATWFEMADGSRVWSLRSREGGADVSEIAKKRGGGGHRAAAGFTGSQSEPV